MATTEVQEEFWAEVKDKRTELTVSLKNKLLKGQPPHNAKLVTRSGRKEFDNNALYLISKRNRDRGTFPGHIVLVPVELAGQRLIEETHEIATEEQINEFLQNQQEEANRIHLADISKKMQYHQAVPDGARFVTPTPIVPAAQYAGPETVKPVVVAEQEAEPEHAGSRHNR